MSLPKLPPVTLDTFGESELDDLDDRIAHVLRLRSGMMGEPATLKEVGEELGVGRERIRQLENEGLTLIRNLREVQRHERLQPTRRRGRGYVWNRLRRVET
ncbi:MAG TPA: sigma factor-like helix-turn-helix DNA-binding protein [Solirubrobacterales bacterium]|jgi:DNA-directed RNA polymerase sigma subunit (sigma70/sigma32)|nr:sigma factor-like helix-turn-helix DNA-binding protein [Solirubrobacterales bacterium]